MSGSLAGQAAATQAALALTNANLASNVPRPFRGSSSGGGCAGLDHPGGPGADQRQSGLQRLALQGGLALTNAGAGALSAGQPGPRAGQRGPAADGGLGLQRAPHGPERRHVRRAGQRGHSAGEGHVRREPLSAPDPAQQRLQYDRPASSSPWPLCRRRPHPAAPLTDAAPRLNQQVFDADAAISDLQNRVAALLSTSQAQAATVTSLSAQVAAQQSSVATLSSQLATTSSNLDSLQTEYNNTFTPFYVGGRMDALGNTIRSFGRKSFTCSLDRNGIYHIGFATYPGNTNTYAINALPNNYATPLYPDSSITTTGFQLLFRLDGVQAQTEFTFFVI